MDSLTQILLGVSVSYGVLGKSTKSIKVPLILGAVIGTVPDLDVVFRYVDPIDNFVHHRGWSHSLIMHVVMAPILMVLARLCSSALRDVSKLRLFFAIYLILSTHALLDAFTVYGTQLFWPYTEMSPVSIGALFIIDPIYTGFLLFGLCGVIWGKGERKYFYNLIGFTLSFFYIFVALTSQAYIQKSTVYTLLEQNIAFDNYKVSPTPLNTFLWRIIVRFDGGYKIGYMSIFDENKNIEFTTYKSLDALNLDDNTHVRKIKHFANGFFKIYLNDKGEVILSDLRMGAENGYVFSYAIGVWDQENATLIPYELSKRVLSMRKRQDYIDKVWARIWDETVKL